jgi:hypothetical protein
MRKIAPRRVLRVTKAILLKSVRMHGGNCLAGTAIREQISGAWGINVTSESLTFNVGERKFVHP